MAGCLGRVSQLGPPRRRGAKPCTSNSLVQPCHQQDALAIGRGPTTAPVHRAREYGRRSTVTALIRGPIWNTAESGLIRPSEDPGYPPGRHHTWPPHPHLSPTLTQPLGRRDTRATTNPSTSRRTEPCVLSPARSAAPRLRIGAPPSEPARRRRPGWWPRNAKGRREPADG